jgi:hypothetical protein
LEFQTRPDASRVPGMPSQQSLRLEQQPGTTVRPFGEAASEQKAGSDAAGKGSRFAAQSSNEVLIAGGNVAAIGLFQSSDLPSVPGLPRQEHRLTEAVGLSSSAPAPAPPEGVGNLHEIDPAMMAAELIAIASTLRPANLEAGASVPAAGTEGPRAQIPTDPKTNIPPHTLVTGHSIQRISIHHRSDDRSRTDAQWILGQLASAGASKVEMRTTARKISSPVVRYFSPQDAPAASAVAKQLRSKTAVWRVEDCTAYRRKPEPGTIQIWQATAATSASGANKRASR